MNIIPKPQIVSNTEGFIQIEEEISISAQGLNSDTTELFCERIELYCNIKTITKSSNGIRHNAFITFEKCATVHGACYTIDIGVAGVKVTFADDEAAIYACTSVVHLIMYASQQGGRLQYVHIEDYPKYSHRGVHIDTARHFFDMNELKKVIEHISLLKINVLHWHFADDQAWRIECKTYPELITYCKEEYYTQNDVRNLVAYAAKRGISIIPEIEIPGHSTAAISAYPQLSCKEKQILQAKSGGIYKTILCAGKQETYEFIKKILIEICELFPSQYIHLGADEAPKREWKVCPHCTAKRKALGLDSYEELQAHMLNFATTILQQYGKKAICWNDCLKAQNLNKDIVIQYWSQSLKHLNDKTEIVFSNIMPLYLDYPYSINNLKDCYTYSPKIGRTQIRDDMCIKGIECTLWTERISSNKQLEYMLFPRCAAVAENAWSEHLDYKTFAEGLHYYYSLWKKSCIAAAPLKDAQIHGLIRVVEKIKFLRIFFGMLLDFVKSSLIKP